MKHWMKCLALMLALLMALVACAPADDPAATDDETPSGEEQEDVTPAPLPAEIFKDGTTDYNLVFDDSKKALDAYEVAGAEPTEIAAVAVGCKLEHVDVELGYHKEKQHCHNGIFYCEMVHISLS
jgi:hypothetical protein